MHARGTFIKVFADRRNVGEKTKRGCHVLPTPCMACLWRCKSFLEYGESCHHCHIVLASGTQGTGVVLTGDS